MPRSSRLPKKILLADDSTTVVVMERMTLRGAGYDVITARNGAEAVQMAISERPDLILLDVNLSQLDAIEACRQLRAHETTRAIPIIMVTSRSEVARVQQALDAGANEYLMKPFVATDLLGKLRTYLAD